MIEEPRCRALHDNLAAVIIGKEAQIEVFIAAVLAGGNILIEDVPGTGKTTLARAFAISLAAQYNRIQFTPDLLPTDVLGGSIYNPKEGEFRLFKGPVFTNILLADEINRASPRTQSSLLEAMEEKQVSLEGNTMKLPELFIVLATQNPVEFAGVFPLPESQMDRFLIRLTLGYVDPETEAKMFFDQKLTAPILALKPVITTETMLEMQKSVREIHVDPSLAKYIADLVHASRIHPAVRLGASPRGGMGLFRLAQAFAYMQNREFIRPEDVQKGLQSVFSHRLFLKDEEDQSSIQNEITEEIRQSVAVPT
jgi:MoxR-like ATPase